ncbi:hypothetical protein A9Q84_08575 [Halobacteriovorax marinus]|uniref:Cytochrome c domain-containing protein n=1 Tax=Halobacteriovorax marinus TaxID=97084 RepID=A0A1Y5F670_9BACT|nr:hypothetical protein A9Q84_08575 [Halobacteriovorax marinus]
MKMVILFLALTSMVYGEVDKSLCLVKNTGVTRRFTPKGTPNYFFKASPEGRYIYYITGNKNFRIDTATGEEVLLPGNADPVPSSDGNLLSSINWRNHGKKDWSLNLMPMNDWDVIRDSSGRLDELTLFTDESTRRTYQSVGTLGDNKYRVLSFDDGTKKLVIRDYLLENGKITPLGEKDIFLTRHFLRLPMISRNGQELISLDVNTNETVIYKFKTGLFSKKLNGLDEVDRLPFPSGKGDFSFDGKKVVFHVTETVDKWKKRSGSDEVALPPNFKNNAEVRNIFIYDRETKSVTPVTQNKIGNSYFPVFLEDGSLIYLDQQEGQKLSFVYSEVPKIAPRSLEKAKSCYSGRKFDSVLTKLSNLWMKVCTNWDGADTGASKVMMMNMPIKLCLQLAKESQDKNVEKMCQALKNSEIKTPSIVIEENPVKKMIKVKCQICHQGNIPFDDEKDLAKYKDKILKRINSSDPAYRMPLGGSLSKQEIQDFKSYLESL